MRLRNGILILTLVGITGCGSIMKAFTVESPRPNKEQLQAAQSISTENIPVIAGMQTDKQGKIASVARAGLFAVAKSASSAQSDAVTNIVANAVQAIQDADGTAKILGKNQEDTLENVLRMSTAQYMAAVAGQSAVAMRNQQAVYSGIKTGWEWTRSTLATVIGGSTGGLGLIGFATMMAKRAMERRQLLLATGTAIEDFSASHAVVSGDLKSTLAAAHSAVAINAKKEFGLS